MKLRAAALLLMSVAGLLGIGVGLCFYLLRVGLSATQQVTEERLRAIGVTAAYAVGLASDDTEVALLDSVARTNQLEAAYLIRGGAGGLQPVAQPERGACFKLILPNFPPPTAEADDHGEPSE